MKHDYFYPLDHGKSKKVNNLDRIEKTLSAYVKICAVIWIIRACFGF